MNRLDGITSEWGTPSIAGVRPIVGDFSMLMEHVLRANDHKGGWDECSLLWLSAKIAEELGELNQGLVKLHKPEGKQIMFNDALRDMLIRECVDIAVVAMMTADVLSQRFEEQFNKRPTRE